MRYFGLILGLFFCLVGCKNCNHRQNHINKIEIAAGGGILRAPVIGLILDSSLSLKYYGGLYAKRQGFFEGKVDKPFWDSLTYKFEKIRIKSADTTRNYVLDAEQAEAIIVIGNYKIHVYHIIGDNRDSITNFLLWTLNAYKGIVLQKLKDSVKFETTIQFMKDPIEKKDPVKFPINK